MKKRFWIVPALALVFGLGFTSIGEAGGHKGKCKASLMKKMKKKAKFLESHSAAIGLTADQKKSIHKIEIEAKKEAIKLKADIKVAKIDIKEEMKEHKSDLGKINGLVDTKYSLKSKKSKVLIKAISDMKAVLSAKQYAKAVSIWEKENHKSHCGHCGHGGKGAASCPLGGKCGHKSSGCCKGH